MKLKVGMVGVGAFAQNFIPLFKAHPLVERVVLCDLNPDKLRENSLKHQIPDTSASLDELCDSDVDAIVIITQHWLHAPQAIQALRAGKHVYSAVPTGITMDEITQLVRTVEETRRIYMIGETSYYYPGVIYCREQFRQGRFGHVVYAEGEYYHDWSHGLEDVYRWRYGPRWRELGGDPPMFYPTHSTSQIISVTGARMTHVSCHGFVDREPDTIFNASNQWRNSFSNESALFRMSDGSSCRINEFRRVGHPGAVRMSMFGTLGCYEENCAGPIWVTQHARESQRLDDLLRCQDLPAEQLVTSGGMEKVVSEDGTHRSVARIHPVHRLPREFLGLPNGHAGSHQFLVDDFVRACATGTLPPNNIWQAARYAIPGIIAHESAVRGGELLPIPDLGDAPANWP